MRCMSKGWCLSGAVCLVCWLLIEMDMHVYVWRVHCARRLRFYTSSGLTDCKLAAHAFFHLLVCELVCSECWWMKSMCFLVWLSVCVCLMHAPRIFSSNWTQVYSKKNENRCDSPCGRKREPRTDAIDRIDKNPHTHTSRSLVLLFTIVWPNERSTAYLESGFYSLNGEND